MPIRQRGNELQQLAARDALAYQRCAACGIHTMQGKDILGEIDSQSDNSHGLPLSNELMRHSHFPSWHFVAGRRNARLVRDGEVPFIR